MDLAAGTTTELIGQTVTLQIPGASEGAYPIAGSAFCVGGTGLAGPAFSAAPPLPVTLGGLQLLLDGQPVPLASVTPSQACFQVPWETTTGKHTLTALAQSDPRFTGGSTESLEIDWTAFPSFVRLPAQFPPAVGLQQFPLTVHQGGLRIVTAGNPARPGEILTFYLTGLGPVSPPVADGAAPPVNPPATVVTQPAYALSNLTPDGASTPVKVLSAVMQPGVVGYYQLELQLPQQVPVLYGQALLSCPISPPYGGDSVWLPIAQEPQRASQKR